MVAELPGPEEEKNNKSQGIDEYLLSTRGEEGATRALVAGKLPGGEVHNLEGEQVLVGQVPSSNPVTQLHGHGQVPRHLRHHPQVPLLPVPGLLAGREGLTSEELSTVRIEEGLARGLTPKESHRGRCEEVPQPLSGAIRLTRSSHSATPGEWIIIRLHKIRSC